MMPLPGSPVLDKGKSVTSQDQRLRRFPFSGGACFQPSIHAIGNINGGAHEGIVPYLWLNVKSDLPPLRDGINPGVRSAQTGHHFAGFSNRFWKLLYESRLVPEPITHEDDDRLPDFGFGITNIVPRPTPGIDTLLPGEYVEGRVKLRRKILRYRPAVVAMVGVTVFRAMFPGRRGPVTLGRQPERIGMSEVFVLPNPSGLNAHYRLRDLVTLYRQLHEAIA